MPLYPDLQLKLKEFSEKEVPVILSKKIELVCSEPLKNLTVYPPELYLAERWVL